MSDDRMRDAFVDWCDLHEFSPDQRREVLGAWHALAFAGVPKSVIAGAFNDVLRAARALTPVR